MPMREECVNFQSRTYASGEVARFCVRDLAPEAPWRCPTDCPAYRRRMADVGWVHGSLVEPALEEVPDVPGADMIQVLSDAERIVDAIAPDAVAEARARDAREARAQKRWWRRKR